MNIARQPPPLDASAAPDSNATLETSRVEALRKHAIVDTPADDAFDNIVRLAAMVCDTPTSLISFVNAERQWFKARHGFDTAETARNISFCSHAIKTPHDVFIIADARLDERFATNPMVTGAPFLRFYAGMPVVDLEGFAMGTLCVIDQQVRELDARQLDILRALAKQVSLLLNAGQKTRHLSEQLSYLASNNQMLADALNNLQQENISLNVASKTDVLTGLNNRRGFDAIMQAEQNQARRTGRPLSMIMIDIDLFKIYNDTFGHLEGDRVIASVANILRQSSRASEHSARYGGEEFVMILPSTDAAEACKFAERIRRSIENHWWQHANITVSLGVATVDAATGLEHLAAFADAALYHAKARGRNRVECADKLAGTDDISA